MIYLSSQLHPTVQEFKDFLNKHPKLIKEVRKMGGSWQEYYEKWALLGEDDPFWNDYKDKEVSQLSKLKESDFFNHLIKLTDYIDVNKVQQQVSQLNNTIQIIQGMLGEYVKTKEPNVVERQQRPFHFFKD